MVGLVGRVTGTVGPGLVGEVIVRVRGGAEHFLAHPASAADRIEPGTVVMVVEATQVRGEAAAQATRATGEAEATAAQARGLADAQAAKAKGLAEAEAIKARVAALAQNQEAVVAQQLAENWPEIVKAGASAFGNVDNMVLLNGADGMADMFAKALTMGGTGLGLARQLLASMDRDGQAPVEGSPLDGAARKVPMDEK